MYIGNFQKNSMLLKNKSLVLFLFNTKTIFVTVINAYFNEISPKKTVVEVLFFRLVSNGKKQINRP